MKKSPYLNPAYAPDILQGPTEWFENWSDHTTSSFENLSYHMQLYTYAPKNGEVMAVRLIILLSSPDPTFKAQGGICPPTLESNHQP